MKIEIATWILCGSHDKFENTYEPVFESKLDSNPNWIYVSLSLLLLLGPLILLLLPVFSFFEDFSKHFSTSLKTTGQTPKSLTDSEISKLKTEIYVIKE